MACGPLKAGSEPNAFPLETTAARSLLVLEVCPTIQKMVDLVLYYKTLSTAAQVSRLEA